MRTRVKDPRSASSLPSYISWVPDRVTDFETRAKDDYFDRIGASGVGYLDMNVGAGSWVNAD